jgi:5-methylcytosine-specific restriction endonuclease McrA
MRCYSLSHLSDGALLSGLSSIAARDRATTAELLAHLAEVDERKLYLPAAYPSMLEYCVHELRMSEDTALKRIRVARVAREFPDIFEMVADGRLNPSAVLLLKPYLGPDTAKELLGAAAHKTRSEIERMLADRFPCLDRPTHLIPIAEQVAPGPPDDRGACANGAAPPEVAPGPLEAPTPRTRVEPLAPQRFALQVTIGQETHDKLRYLQTLLSHRVPTNDLAGALDRALDLAIAQLEKRKLAATSRPRSSRATSENPRYISAEVRRKVCERDQGRCTFVSETGKRCEARDHLELDHVDPVARGGQATVDNLRLRCRPHNQLEAERMFGAGFMKERREQARRAQTVHPAGTSEPPQPSSPRVECTMTPSDEAVEKKLDLISGLRGLGYRADQARQAAGVCDDMPDASLEDLFRTALSRFGPIRGV